MNGQDSTEIRKQTIRLDSNAVELNALGVKVTPMTALETVRWATEQTGKHLLLNHNLHSAYIFQKSPAFRDLYDLADKVVIDGAPILWLARRAKPKRLSVSHRIGSTDWLEKLHEADRPGRLYVYGATEESNRDAVANLRASLSDRGWHVEGKNGYVNHAEAIDWLQKGEPTLVIIGLGMPLQEKFLLEAWDELPNAVFATVGGAIDYVAGHNVLAPRWMGRAGIEWFWRLAIDPRRLAHRYLVEPFKLAWTLTRNERRRSERKRSSEPAKDLA